MSFRYVLFLILIFSAASCSVVKGTARGVATVGKAGWGAVKITGKAVKTTGDVAYHTGNALYKTGKFTGKAVRTVVYMAKGRQIIPLERSGNSLYARVLLGRKKIPARLLIDTGASSTQITAQLAAKLGLDPDRAQRIPVHLANGQMVAAREVIIPRVQLQSVQVNNVRALVLEQQFPGDSDGLLGMSFLDHFVFQIDADVPELVLQQKAK